MHPRTLRRTLLTALLLGGIITLAAPVVAAAPAAVTIAAGHAQDVPPAELAADTETTTGIPTATHFSGVPTVGVLAHTTAGVDHFCTASVIASPHQDLIITAAHCIYGMTGVVFIPEYHNGIRPYGSWAVSTVFVDPRWAADRDQDADFAIAVVKPRHGKRIQQVVGADGLAVDQGLRNRTTIIGYPNVVDDPADRPIGCTTETTPLAGYRDQVEFECHGYYDGTSGGPWLLHYDPRTGRGVTDGVIGGWDEGGPNEYESTTSYFGQDVLVLYRRAVSAS
jgi:V8-like Glu-specific endopeptidase